MCCSIPTMAKAKIGSTIKVVKPRVDRWRVLRGIARWIDAVAAEGGPGLVSITCFLQAHGSIADSMSKASKPRSCRAGRLRVRSRERDAVIDGENFLHFESGLAGLIRELVIEAEVVAERVLGFALGRGGMHLRRRAP